MWKKIIDIKPPENIILNTKIMDGNGERNEQHLIRKGNLWFTTDMKTYVYYTPTHWQNI